MDDIARGAALMTGTTLSIEFIKACSNVQPNKVLGRLMQKNFEELGSAKYDDADRALAVKMRATMAQKDEYYREMAQQVEDDAQREKLLADADAPLYEQLFPYPSHEDLSAASTDVGDVSWVCPVAQICTVTMPAGTGMHSWQEVAVGKSAMAKKGMLQAARVIAATAIDVIDDPTIAKRAREELQQRTGGKAYVCPIPKSVLPQL